MAIKVIALFLLSFSIVVSFVLIIWVLFNPPEIKSIEYRYHSNREIESIVQRFASEHPEIARSHLIGQTKRNNSIWALEISDNPGEHEPGEAEIKLIANIHGNEAIGRELLLHLIDLLIGSYRTDPQIKWLVDNLRIHIVPTMNPDGFDRAIEGDCMGIEGRENANQIDLNRNFPDQFYPRLDEIQPETSMIMNWSRTHPFVLSLSLHGGALVANYPFDNNQENRKNYSKSPDDDVFRYLAHLYSKNHPQMSKGRCEDVCDLDLIEEYFPDGITNGAEWYPVNGGMQDWNYIECDCFELTIETGCRKFPHSNTIRNYWKEHRNSLLQFMMATYNGINGFVFDQNHQPLSNAIISIEGIDKNITTKRDGDYWRLLTPNRTYTIEVRKDGFKKEKIENFLLENSHQINFTLIRDSL
ncbi:Carboxypeptidase -like protein [Sarcoptes scabiei]|uniref:Carboxypeptidase -like protein n=1 Tax=Sarcoptes scabiei TaxID=52283 RepID=A0A834R4P5_SARSC|nr:Carboxypeptidase -like protein [Sarcoptes scabiei]